MTQYRDSIGWVLKEFGNRTALDLEMVSTLIFVDRSLAEKGARASISELAKKVHDIKPHLKTETIEREGKSLMERGFLNAVPSADYSWRRGFLGGERRLTRPAHV